MTGGCGLFWDLVFFFSSFWADGKVFISRRKRRGEDLLRDSQSELLETMPRETHELTSLDSWLLSSADSKQPLSLSLSLSLCLFSPWSPASLYWLAPIMWPWLLSPYSKGPRLLPNFYTMRTCHLLPVAWNSWRPCHVIGNALGEVGVVGFRESWKLRPWIWLCFQIYSEAKECLNLLSHRLGTSQYFFGST